MWPVPCGGDAQPVLAGEVDDGDHVVGALRQRDRDGPLVDGEVPGLAGLSQSASPGTTRSPVDGTPSSTAEVGWIDELCAARRRALMMDDIVAPFELFDEGVVML